MTEKIDFTADYGARENSSIIKVIGVGGGGGNAVSHMFNEGIIGVDFLACNTDKGHLSKLPIPETLVLGDTGLGAGANPETARKLALDSKEKIKQFIDKGTKMLFITAGMGKGTGTGASPVIAEIARSMNILTIGVVTYPFRFEGTLCAKRADAGIEELSKHVDSLIVVKNQNIMKFYNNEDLDTAFGYADDVLKNAVKCIAELITVDYEHNIDFSDIQTIMKDSGRAMLGIATASGENRVDKVVEDALACPLLDNIVCADAKNFLFFIGYGEKDKLKCSELNALAEKFEKIQSQNVRVIWGRGLDKDLDDAIKLSVIVTNFSDAKTLQSVVLPDHDQQKQPATNNLDIMVTEQPMTEHIIDEKNDVFRSTTDSISDLQDDFGDLTDNWQKTPRQTFQNHVFKSDEDNIIPQNHPYDQPVKTIHNQYADNLSPDNTTAKPKDPIKELIDDESTPVPVQIGDPHSLTDEQFDILVSQPTIMRNQAGKTAQTIIAPAAVTSLYEMEDDAHDFFKDIPD